MIRALLRCLRRCWHGHRCRAIAQEIRFRERRTALLRASFDMMVAANLRPETDEPQVLKLNRERLRVLRIQYCYHRRMVAASRR